MRTGENVDFGKYLPVFPNEIINCPILNIECNQYKNGVILSPYFPIKITDERLFRKVLNKNEQLRCVILTFSD